MSDFKLWLEFEEVDPVSWNTKNEFANIHVELADGRRYGINVWTYKFLETEITKNIDSNGSPYIIPPDLIVQELTRECIHESVEELLKIGDLEKVLNPGIIASDRI